MYTRSTNSTFTDCKLLEPSAYVDGIIDQLPEPKKNGAGSTWASYAKQIICGGVAGVVSRTCTAPVDRLKVLLQVQGQQQVVGCLETGGNQTLGAYQMTRAMLNEGVLTMWKGNFVNCLKIFPENAIRLCIFEQLNERQCLTKNRLWHIRGNVTSKFANGAVTGILVQTVMYPFEIVKTRIMTLPAKSGKMGVWEAGRKILNDNGKTSPLNFYKGFLPAIIGVIPFAGLELGCSKTGTEWYKEHFKTSNPGWWPLLAIGTTSSFIAMGCTYPFRLITCRMQAYTGPEKDRLTPVGHVRKIFRNEGMKGYYRGFFANSLKAVPSSGIAWTVFNRAQVYWDRSASYLYS